MEEGIVNAGVSSVASKIAESFYDIIQREISYVFKYQRYVEKLRSQLVALNNKRQRVEQTVKDAERHGDQIFDDVQQWLNQVINFIQRVEKSIDEEEENAKNKRCFIKLCPNLMTRYKLSKEAVKEEEVVVDLLGKGNFSNVSCRPSTRRTEFTNIDRGYQQFDSRMKAFQDVMEALKDSKVNMIGVHGMGGVGKTTLAKQVEKKVMEEKIFDTVVMAEVTPTPDLKIIQDKIASDLGLKFELNDSVYERANRLCQRLKKEKRLLVILDNIWGKLDLNAVGIPVRDDKKETLGDDKKEEKDTPRPCTILSTSRDLNVLCNDMKTKKNISIEVLSDEEATSLFWKIVDDRSVETSDFQPLAAGIVEKCGGLPVAITTIATALRNKGHSVWKDALHLLSNSNPRQIHGMDKDVYSSIELSYNFLESNEAKSLFRMCGLLNDGRRIPIDDLMMYGIGLDMFTNVETMEARRNRVHTLINNLKTSCLLLDGDTEDAVKMHDVIHVVAKTIATDELILNIRNVVDLKEEAIAISLLDGDIQDFPETLKCPKLKLFLLFAKYESSLQIPNLFFEGMEELRVLHITEICFSPLPSSLGFLVNLKTLSLINCQLEDVSIVGKLKQLEILSFRGSNIEQLPVEIGQLARLKLLDLSMCSELTIIAPNVISKLSHLEELYMDSFTQWEKVEEQRNASLAELKELSNLRALVIRITDIQVMPQDLFSVQLERYKISVGDAQYWNWNSKYETPRSLKLEVNNNIYSGYQLLLNRPEDLWLNTLNGFQSVVPELDREGFPRLKHLCFQRSNEILYIVNSARQIHFNIFPLLESLFLYNLVKLEKICQGQLTDDQSFSNLRIIKVKQCHGLKHLFSFSMAKNLLRLQEIGVSDCDDIKLIVGEESEIHEARENKSFSGINFTQLRSLILEGLPQLTSSGFNPERPEAMSATTSASQEIIAEDNLKTLFNNKVIFPNVEELKLRDLNIEKIWLDQFPAMFSCSHYLTKLDVRGCHNLKSLFSSSMVKNLERLQELRIQSCESMEAVCLEREEQMIDMVFPKLVRLELFNLPNLTEFGIGNSIEFPTLRELEISFCMNLKRFISSSTFVEENIHTETQGALFDEKVKFPNLEVLRISGMGNKSNKIWHHQLALDSFSKLKVLRVLFWDDLRCIFPFNMSIRLQGLQILEVWSCSSLESIIEISGFNLKEVPRFVFPQLTTLDLQYLPNLQHFYPGIHISEFPVLENLEINNCMKVQTLASSKLLSQSQNQQHEKEMEIIQKQPFFNLDKAGLSTLKKLTINQINNLKIWHKMEVASESNMVGGLQKLEELDISSCQFEEINELMETTTQLRELTLFDVDNLKQLWPTNDHGTRLQGFQNLISIKVSYLARLKTLFPAPVARGLHWLQQLFIDSLEQLEEIVAEEEAAVFSSSYRFVFPQLTSLHLESLPNLKRICPAKYISDWPMLKELEISYCAAVKILASSEYMSQESQQPLFLVDSNKAAFPRLETLQLDNLHNVLHLWNGTSHPCNGFQNLRTLIIYECNALEQLVPSSVSLKNLTTLDVTFCDELRNSVTVSSNLTTVNVKSCNKLRNLVTLSMTESKVKLGSIDIGNCEMLENIVQLQVRKEVKEDHVVFSQLKDLKLSSFPRLRSFCSGDYSTLEFPFLKEVLVHKCPSMKIFSQGDLHTPRLHKVKFPFATKEEECWEGTLNSTIQKLFEEMVGYDGIEYLKLSEFPQVKEKWHSQALPIKIFNYLTSLVVDDCTFMSSVIPANLLRFLNNLKTLKIRNCDSVETVLHLEELNADGHLGTLFPKLQRLVLLDLPKLKTFCNFTKDIIELPKLNTLQIENCPNMETFISNSTQVEITPNKESREMTSELEEINILVNMQPLFDEKVAFPCLEELKLSKLPRLLHLCKENSDSGNVLQNMKSLEISECHDLERVVPSSVSFKNLQILEVSKCNRLKNLVTLSTAKSLVNIREIKVIDCGMIEKVIDLLVGEEVKEDSIVFSQLKYVTLERLPSLTNFYLGNYMLEFSSLQKVIVRECPKMKIYFRGALITPSLQRLQLTEAEDEDRWEGDLNSNVRSSTDEDISIQHILDVQ